MYQMLKFKMWLAEGVEKHVFNDAKIKELQTEFNLLMKNAAKISNTDQLFR